MSKINCTCAFYNCSAKHIQIFRNVRMAISKGNCDGSYTRNLYLEGILGSGFFCWILLGTYKILSLVLELTTAITIRKANPTSMQITASALLEVAEGI